MHCMDKRFVFRPLCIVFRINNALPVSPTPMTTATRARSVRADARADHSASEPQVAQQYAAPVRVPEPRRAARLRAPARHRHVRGAHGRALVAARRRCDQRDALDALSRHRHQSVSLTSALVFRLFTALCTPV